MQPSRSRHCCACVIARVVSSLLFPTRPVSRPIGVDHQKANRDGIRGLAKERAKPADGRHVPQIDRFGERKDTDRAIQRQTFGALRAPQPTFESRDIFSADCTGTRPAG